MLIPSCSILKQLYTHTLADLYPAIALYFDSGGLFVSEYNFGINYSWPDFDGEREALDILQVLPIIFTWQTLKDKLIFYFKNKTELHHFTVHQIRPIILLGFFLKSNVITMKSQYIITLLAGIGSIHVRKTWKQHVFLCLKH